MQRFLVSKSPLTSDQIQTDLHTVVQGLKEKERKKATQDPQQQRRLQWGVDQLAEAVNIYLKGGMKSKTVKTTIRREKKSNPFSNAPRREVDSQPISRLARPTVSQSFGQAGRQTKTHSLGFLSVAVSVYEKKMIHVLRLWDVTTSKILQNRSFNSTTTPSYRRWPLHRASLQKFNQKFDLVYPGMSFSKNTLGTD